MVTFPAVGDHCPVTGRKLVLGDRGHVYEQHTCQRPLPNSRTATVADPQGGDGKDFRIGPPKISHFATLEWQKTMLEAKRRLNFDAEMQ